MLPGARSQHGQLYVTGGVPLTTDPRLSGFALKPTGEVYASISGGNVWSPAELFMEGEQGIWYDRSDLSTMFQDDIGKTPVTAAGQPVGLILDKHNGVTELPVTGWVKVENGGDGVVTINGNVVTITGATTTTGVDITPGWAVGDLASITIDADIANATSPVVYIGEPFFPTQGLSRNTHRILGGTVCRLQIAAGSATFTVTGRSKVVGNHATAPYSTARPIYQTDGTYHWLEYDAIDDFTSTLWTAPTELSTHFSGQERTVASNWVMFAQQQNASGGFYGVCSSGDSTPANNGAGNCLYSVNGSPPATATRDSMNTLIGTAPCVLTVTDIDFSGSPVWAGFAMGAYTGFSAPFKSYSVIVVGRQCTPEEIANAEAWVNSQTGAY